ncbi:MAG: hypothetical protein M1445_13115, partial [Bacteroidetes bacterium]|nr:hypothetical protein [Bacteroidota bacterium]
LLKDYFNSVNTTSMALDKGNTSTLRIIFPLLLNLTTAISFPAMFNGLPVTEIGHLVMSNALPGMNKKAGNASQKILI